MTDQVKKRGRGRPPKECTPLKAEAIIEAIKAGANRDVAARVVGVSDVTLRKWIASDPQFAEDVELADAIARMNAEQTIYRSKDWRAQLAFLQSKYPQDWATRQKVEHSNAEGQAFKTENTNTTVNVTPEDLKNYDAGELARMYKDALTKPESS